MRKLFLVLLVLGGALTVTACTGYGRGGCAGCGR
jgi:hypothetical protein